MKKKYSLLAMLLFGIAVSYTQIDRSRPPKHGPTPKIHLQEPARFELDNGLKVMVVENSKLPQISIWLTLDNPPIPQGNKAGVSDLTSYMLGEGSRSISKDDFCEEVDFLGATFDVNDKGASVHGLSRHFPRILELMADVVLKPNFTQEVFERGKDKLIDGIRVKEKDVAVIATRMQSALAYGKNHPYGEMMTEATINNITLADITRHYKTSFVSNHAYLVVVGDVTFDQVKQHVTQYFSDWIGAKPHSFHYADTNNASHLQINFVDVPNAVQSEIAVQYLTELKIKDENYLPTLLANDILGGGAQARLFKNLREDKGYTYGAYSSLQEDKYSATYFKTYTQVHNAMTDSTVIQILNEMSRIATEPVTKSELDRAKANCIGSFLMSLEKPETLADFALNIEIKALPKDFYTKYVERIEAITIEDVQKAAQTHLSPEKAQIVVVGRGSEVVEHLEKITFKNEKIPISYYDTYANVKKDPKNRAVVAEKITARTILEKYINAIGGQKKLEGIASYAMRAKGEIQGMPLQLETKKTGNRQFMREIKVMGHSMQKQVLNGEKGYMVVQKKYKDMEPDEIERVKDEAMTFPELDYLLAGNVTLQGIEPIGGKKAYKLKITGQKTAFYDVNTGLKIREITNEGMRNQPLHNIVTFDDYQEVSGVKFPFALSQTVGPQHFEFTVTEIKVNEGVNSSDFE